MRQPENQCDNFGKSGPVWHIPVQSNEIRNYGNNFNGTLVLDVDGCLTVESKDYAIDQEVLDTLADVLKNGGNLIFNTGATRRRIERTVLAPLFDRLDDGGMHTANEIFSRVILMPENGSAILLKKEITVEENELNFKWYRIHELHVPQKDRLRNLIEQELLHLYPHAYIAGNLPDDPSQREYILSLKKVTDTLALKEKIETTIVPNNPEIDWNRISIKAARTTIDFIHRDSGKTLSVIWILKELSGLSGPVLGFGDLGDEFAKVIPTLNVNKGRPNEFRKRGMPAMELNRWRRLCNGEYVITGKGPEAKVRQTNSDREIMVVRDQKGSIIFTKTIDDSNKVTVATPETGCPMAILPLTIEVNSELLELKDAGNSTSWIIKRLIQVGYFSQSNQ